MRDMRNLTDDAGLLSNSLVPSSVSPSIPLTSQAIGGNRKADDGQPMDLFRSVAP